MTILKIVQYPSKKLQRIGSPVVEFDPALQKNIDDMFATHYAAKNCAALAATQLELEHPGRICVIDFSPEKNQPLCLVNPRIVEAKGEQYEYEGCMSVFPSIITAKVKRALHITVEAQDRYGHPLHFEAEGYLAKCIQHELDHLDGKLYLSRLNTLSHARLMRKIKKHLRTLKS